MKLGIMQPYFVPYIGYWQLMNAVDEYVIYDDVQYIKGGWIARNRILLANEPFFLSLRTQGASPNRLINEVHLDGDMRYRQKLLKTLEQAYKKAPYYPKTMELMAEILLQNEGNLALFLANSIRMVADYLQITPKFRLSSSVAKDNALRGVEKVLAICRQLGADEYLNAIGGRELYDKRQFNEQGIELKFLDSHASAYPQFGAEFVSNLSIIDVMMFNAQDKVRQMLTEFHLI